MVFAYLTTVTLDVITGAAWWTVSKTYNGRDSANRTKT